MSCSTCNNNPQRRTVDPSGFTRVVACRCDDCGAGPCAGDCGETVTLADAHDVDGERYCEGCALALVLFATEAA